MKASLPDLIHNEAELGEVMTRPTPALRAFISTLQGPLVVLGAGGKMGPSLCVRARRAAEEAGHALEVVAVSRFSNPKTKAWLEAQGVQTTSGDLMNRDALATLPDAENVIYLVGLKFGTQADPAQTWAVNTLIPAYVTERYARARIVALSTGNVYPLVDSTSRGSVETDPLTPAGEYANACVARERIFEYAARQQATPLALIRLNYALDLRYGVLVDLAKKIAAEQPIDVAMGYLNCIWQGDANGFIIRSLGLADTPPVSLNLTSPEVYSVRDLAKRLGGLMNHPVQFIGEEAETALLSDATRICTALGNPPTPVDAVLRWTAHWVLHGGTMLNKPTHFEVRDGYY